MDLPLPIIGVALVIGSVILSAGLERLIRRVGVSPTDPEDRSRGFRDVLSRVADWRDTRDSERKR